MLAVHSSNLEANVLAAWIESGVDVQHNSEEEITVSLKMGNVSDSEDIGDDLFKGVVPTVS
jgi:hypothetical protein